MNKSELESKHLSELHALAAEAGVERYRMLSRGDLIARLADGGGRRGGGEGGAGRPRPPARRPLARVARRSRAAGLRWRRWWPARGESRGSREREEPDQPRARCGRGGGAATAVAVGVASAARAGSRFAPAS